MFPFSIVSFADYVEELGHPYIWVQTLGGLHFPNDSSEVGLLSPDREARVCVRITCSIIDIFVCFFSPSSACTWGKLPECQSNGEHHEATEGTTSVPPGFDQTVCLFRFVRCDRLTQIQRFFQMENIFRVIFVFAPAAEHSIIPVTSECQHLFPAKIMSRLARWTPITHEDYKV